MAPQIKEESTLRSSSGSGNEGSEEGSSLLDQISNPSFPLAEDPAAKSRKEEKSSPWWVNGAFVVFVHIVAALAPFIHIPAGYSIPLCTFAVFFMASLGITAGYHRLWSHRAYKASSLLRITLAIWGTLAFQGSIKWWVLRHRIHHRFTDTEDDPYTIKKGFFFAHMGWIFEKPVYKKMKLIDASDLNADWVVRFQHQYYVPLALGFGFGIPILIGAALGDILGAVLYIGFWVRLFVWHATFCINSLAHYIGDREYAWNITAAGNIFLSLITSGEGYHNFHHVFPVDYRNGVKWYDYDPTKWFIATCWFFGLAFDLKKSDQEEIEKARIEGIQHDLEERRQKLDWGQKECDLPAISFQEFQERVSQEKQELFVLDGFVIDATNFKETHPGGTKILRAFYGKDASDAFHGGLNTHTSAAMNIAKKYWIARIQKDSSKEKEL